MTILALAVAVPAARGLTSSLECDDLVSPFDDFMLWNNMDTEFSGSSGGIAIWVAADAMSADGTVARIEADTSNYVRIYWDDSVTDYALEYDAGGTLETGDTLDLVDDGSWHHIIVTWHAAGDIVDYWQDGADRPSDGTLGTFAGTIAIQNMCRHNSTSRGFAGRLAHVQVFTRGSLAAGVISGALHCPDYLYAANLISWFPLWYDTSPLARDVVGHENGAVAVPVAAVASGPPAGLCLASAQ